MLDKWLNDELLLSISSENNLAETAFIVPIGKDYEIINEDLVTGSAHTSLIPLRSKKPGRTELTAEQLSKHGGQLLGEYNGDWYLIDGKIAFIYEGFDKYQLTRSFLHQHKEIYFTIRFQNGSKVLLLLLNHYRHLCNATNIAQSLNRYPENLIIKL